MQNLPAYVDLSRHFQGADHDITLTKINNYSGTTDYDAIRALVEAVAAEAIGRRDDASHARPARRRRSRPPRPNSNPWRC